MKMSNDVYTYGLTHFAINVKDLQRTKKFYQDVFGMEVMYEKKEFIQLTTPGSNDILVFNKSQKANGNSGGIQHFGFRLRKPEYSHKIEQKIIEAGGIIVDKGDFVPGSPYIYFKDPDGYDIEIWYELLQ